MSGRGRPRPGLSLLSFRLALRLVLGAVMYRVPQRAPILPPSANSRLGPLSNALAVTVAHVFYVDVLVVKHVVLARARPARRVEKLEHDPRLVRSLKN